MLLACLHCQHSTLHIVESIVDIARCRIFIAGTAFALLKPADRASAYVVSNNPDLV